MIEQIDAGLRIANDFAELGANCAVMSARMRALVKSYSDEEVSELVAFYWENIEPKKHLFDKTTADGLMLIVPFLKELFEINQKLDLIPSSTD